MLKIETQQKLAMHYKIEITNQPLWITEISTFLALLVALKPSKGHKSKCKIPKTVESLLCFYTIKKGLYILKLILAPYNFLVCTHIRKNLPIRVAVKKKKKKEIYEKKTAK